MLDTLKKFDLLSEICERAEKEIAFIESTYDRFTMLMDLEFAYDHYGLDLERLLKADSLNFGHDVVGIHNNIDRKAMTLVNGWTPRHTK